MTALMTALEAALKANPALFKALMAPKPGSKFAKKAKKGRKPQASTDDRKAAFAANVVATFAKLGVAVRPNEDVFTYNRWIERGFRVIPGEKSVRVKVPGMNGGGIPLFHKGQVTEFAAPADAKVIAIDPAQQKALDEEYGQV